ncbi:hypothetical protein [Okeania sp. KiyG1]|nr:hypothetical protein [Okeania sp. KiyG1]
MRVGNVIEGAIATRKKEVGVRFSFARGCDVYLCGIILIFRDVY